jgi:hypothetical protein
VAVKVGYWGDEEEDIDSREAGESKGVGLYAALTRRHDDSQGAALTAALRLLLNNAANYGFAQLVRASANT